MVYDSVSTWRVYAAEQSVPLGRDLKDADGVQTLVEEVTHSSWWSHNVPNRGEVTVEVVGYEHVTWTPLALHAGLELEDGEVLDTSDPQRLAARLGDLYDPATHSVQTSSSAVSYAAPLERRPHSPWKISIHPEMCNELIVLHELAHCAAPRLRLGPRRRRPGELHSHSKLPSHGEGFTGIMAALANQFAAAASHGELTVAYRHFEVPVMDLEGYQSAARDSLLAEEDEASALDELREADERLFEQRADATAGGSPVPLVGVIPESWWGEDLWQVRRFQSRRQGKFLSQADVAAVVSRVEPCTRRDISAIERSRHRPRTRRQLRIAMCAAVALNFDPIYARHRLDLVRWDCDVELEELELINPEWVELVNRMNKQLEDRPPHWTVDGER